MSKYETVVERHAKIYPVILSECNPEWPEWYAEEKTNLERLVGFKNIARISHFGSTSVPGFTAKPTIDILLEINEAADIDKLITSLSSPDYIYLKEESTPYNLMKLPLCSKKQDLPQNSNLKLSLPVYLQCGRKV